MSIKKLLAKYSPLVASKLEHNKKLPDVIKLIHVYSVINDVINISADEACRLSRTKFMMGETGYLDVMSKPQLIQIIKDKLLHEKS